MFVLVCLVEDAEYFHQPVVDMSMEQRNLNDDAVVHKALNKGIG